MRATAQWTQFHRYPATAGTIVLAVVATLWWWSGGSIDMLEENALLSRGQVWRFVTSALPHVSLLHLAFNLYWCWVFGTLVEGVFGSLRTLGILVLLAAGSGAADYALMDGGVGLSGVGYGLFGLLWMLQRRDRRFADALNPQTVVLFVVWFFICIVTTIKGVMAVGNVAHGAGAALGALMGLAITATQYRKVAIAMPIVAVAVCIAGATYLRPWTNLSADAGRDEAYRGYEALEAQRDEEAVAWCMRAAKLSPAMAENWTNLAIALERTGRESEAAAAFEEARKLDPGSTAERLPSHAEAQTPPLAPQVAQSSDDPNDPFVTIRPSPANAAIPATAPTSQSAGHREWAEAITIEGLPNLHRVSPVVYRSAQPTKQGMGKLKGMGIRSVISLRAFHDDEDELADVAGIRGFRIRFNTWHPEKEDAVRFLKLVTDPENLPVLVHCQHGADRTGTMCALYRMAVQGWTKEEAIREMTEGDYGFHGVWTNLIRWLKAVDVEELRKEAGLK